MYVTNHVHLRPDTVIRTSLGKEHDYLALHLAGTSAELVLFFRDPEAVGRLAAALNDLIHEWTIAKTTVPDSGNDVRPSAEDTTLVDDTSPQLAQYQREGR